jgi:signal transduction histidine kinase
LKIKITQKFLLFGLIPALVQVVILAQLFFYLGAVKDYAEQEVQQSLVARTLVSAVAQSMELALALGAYAAMPLDQTAKNMQVASESVDKAFAELLTVTKNDPTTYAEIKQMMAIGSISKSEFFTFKHVETDEGIENDSPIKNINMKKVKDSQKFIHRIRQLTKILDRQNARLEEIRSKQKQNRTAVERLVLAELVITIVGIAGAYIVFKYDFGRRFNDLLQIAQDLALDKPASQTISGGDELSELSEALITAAEARREAVSQKQMLFQMVTHDLRSPLMAASLVVDTLLRDNSATEEKKQIRLQGVERSLQRVVGLANDLLTIERLSAGGLEIDRTRVNFQETIEHAIETVQPLADQKKCELVNSSPKLAVSIDEDRVLQVIINLAANAIKFSPPGAQVEITAANEGSHLRVEVLDRGPGISDKDIKRLFNPFQQVSEGDKAVGFGLGLAIAKMLVDLHEGNIGARPRPGGGTIFWFTLRI